MSRFIFFFGLLCACATASSVVELTSDTFDDIVNGDRDVFVKFYAPWCGHCKTMIPAMDELGEAFSSIKEVVVAKVDATEHGDIASRYGVSGYPTLKFFPKGSKEATDYSGGRTAEDMVAFINKEAGTKGRIKATPSDVVVLTDDNFKSIVLDESKDVFVEFYAPWCGHCKTAAPHWEKTGTTFASDEDVVIAKLDADRFKSVASEYEVTGFPTFKYFPKDNKAGEPYQGGREAKDFVAFMNDKAGKQRLLGGELTEDAGRYETLDGLAAKFLSGDREAVLAEARTFIEDKTDKFARFYVSVMEKIQDKGDSYVADELARIGRVLDGGSVNAARKDSFYIRRNILKQF